MNLSTLLTSLKEIKTIQDLNPLDKEQILIGVTITHEMNEIIHNSIELVLMKENDPFRINKFKSDGELIGIPVYIIKKQKAPVRMWFTDQREQLNKYLKENE